MALKDWKEKKYKTHIDFINESEGTFITIVNKKDGFLVGGTNLLNLEDNLFQKKSQAIAFAKEYMRTH